MTYFADMCSGGALDRLFGGYVRIVLDMNSIISAVEAENEALTTLLRMGHAHEIEVRVTDTAHREAEEDGNETRRAKRCRQIRGFPEILSNPSEQVEQLASDIYNLVFGSKDPASNSRANREADARHLAESIIGVADVFVTSDKEMLTKADDIIAAHGLKVLTPSAALALIAEASASHIEDGELNLPNVLIRPANDEEFVVVRDLLTPLADNYPDFNGWLDKQWRKKDVRKKVVVVDGQVVGVSIAGPKDGEASVVKLSTFYVDEDHRAAGIGQHLLYHELRFWASHGTRKIFVTVSIRKQKLIRFFTDLGFAVEGVSACRYGSASHEVILARHLLHEKISEEKITELAERIVCDITCADVTETSEGMVRGKTSLPSTLGPLQPSDINVSYGDAISDEALTRHLYEKNSTPLLEIRDDRGNLHTLDALDLESRFYPLRLERQDCPAFIIPIQQRWAQALFQWKEPQLSLFSPEADKRFLRLDNVYYRAPTFTDKIKRGARILFHVTRTPQPPIGIVGSALIERVEVDDPETLYVRYGGLGIFGLKDIQELAKRTGKAMAIRFTWFEPLDQIVPLTKIREVVPSVNPVTVFAIDHDQYKGLCALGGAADK